MMTQIWWTFPLMIFFTGIYSFISNRKHLLSMLLSLEYLVVGLYVLLFMYLSIFNYEHSILIMFLTFTVCEGALGLSILVAMTRSHGNDYFQSFNLI